MESVQSKTLRSVIWAAMKADPVLVLIEVTAQEDAIVPSTSTADILAAYDKPITASTPADLDNINFNGDDLFKKESQSRGSPVEHKSGEGEKDPFDFW